jgi:hypothetical protein
MAISQLQSYDTVPLSSASHWASTVLAYNIRIVYANFIYVLWSSEQARQLNEGLCAQKIFQLHSIEIILQIQGTQKREP